MQLCAGPATRPAVSWARLAPWGVTGREQLATIVTAAISIKARMAGLRQLERMIVDDRSRRQDSPAPCRSELPDTMKGNAAVARGLSAGAASTGSANKQGTHRATISL